MNKTLLAALTPTERLLVSETEPAALALLDEDETSALHTRVQRARTKAQGVYRRGASGKVAAKGGRGKAGPQNTHARTKAEAFEEALGRVSARLATLARQSARDLRDERLAAAAACEGRRSGRRFRGHGDRAGPRDAPSRRSARATAASARRRARRSVRATREPTPAGSPSATRAEIGHLGHRPEGAMGHNHSLRPSLAALTTGSHRVAA